MYTVNGNGTQGCENFNIREVDLLSQFTSGSLLDGLHITFS